MREKITKTPKFQFRSIFISDVHLGSKACQAELLNNFLKNHSCENLYLLGDIIDGWRIKKSFYWPESHSHVIRQFINKQRHRANIVYVLGNHDGFLRHWTSEIMLEGITLCNEATHVGVDGKRYLLIHGDVFDTALNVSKWMTHVGDSAYDALIFLNRIVNRIRRCFRMRHYSLSRRVKQNVKQAINFVRKFESILLNYCDSKKFDGVICGHIHFPMIRQDNKLWYMNPGDWQENCSAIVEHMDGTFELLYWNEMQ
jgi:UDP-2,3-diacylglucosamine pyrophosphatase LpxH